MILSFNESSTQALFSCVAGYYLDGQSLLTCGQNGTWDYQTPVCSKNKVIQITYYTNCFKINIKITENIYFLFIYIFFVYTWK
jgi:hypothetical protein